LSFVWAAEETLNEVADSTSMRKWKYMSVNGCEFDKPIFATTEFLDECQNGADASMCSGLVRNNDTAAEYTSLI
jgi:hypothetical protein